MIRFQNVNFCYSHGQPVLRNVSLEIPAGLTLLLGPNGSGKSTLLKMAAGVEKPDSGAVSVLGRDLWEEEIAARQFLAYVPEQPDLTPYATIDDVIGLVCRLRGQPPSEGRQALSRAGLAHAGNRSVRELSMGQRRRAVLAAAWIGSPRVILLDEPLESMDRTIREEILRWIDRLRAAGASLLIATHEIEPFVVIADRAISVDLGLCRLQEPLPQPGARIAYLEKLSRASLSIVKSSGSEIE
jgi:ABC-2 type transport system ATP-binding protein